MLWFAIILLIIILAALIAVWVVQRNYRKKLSDLDKQMTGLPVAHIDKQIRALKGLHLTGESLKSFTKWQREYQKLSEGDGARAEALMMDAETAVAKFQLGSAKNMCAELADLIAALGKKYANIAQEVEKIYQDEENNRKQLDQLRKDYQEARKTLLAKNFAFGDTMPALDKRLKAVASEFDAVDEITASGDHQAAHERILALSAEVADLTSLTKTIPPLLTELVKEFPEQLEELTSAYHKLRGEHYQFANVDIAAELKKVQVAIKNSQTALNSLNVAASTEQNKATAATIDSLYDVMQKEMDAKRVVVDTGDRISQFLQHALRQSHLLLLELDHLNQSYSLNHDEIKTANALRQELNSLNAENEADQQALADKTAVYSVVAKHYQDDDKRLREIEQQQHDINESVSGLTAGEKSAQKALDEFARDLRSVRRELEALSLPGLPQDFLDRYAHVKEEITSIGQQMDRVKIDLDDIGKQMIGLQADMDNLQQASTEIVDAVGMCAQLLQAANRYRDEHPELAGAITKCKALYAQIEYKEAADTLAAALEEAVPGSYQKAEDAYLSDKTATPL
ncbi:septation ring formation regulator EzrA [Lacticaseibacillus zhaodongensis]|uniref:septation ring formation regulator EzrA n=1 Tax=Lacticaseibacillus zhaodongensis TaxID=2668065 RepID=UPI0012D34860|nr:septation ring formation regulator EzrA [Lacticaseibacillus zhaodongensis]